MRYLLLIGVLVVTQPLAGQELDFGGWFSEPVYQSVIEPQEIGDAMDDAREGQIVPILFAETMEQAEVVLGSLADSGYNGTTPTLRLFDEMKLDEQQSWQISRFKNPFVSVLRREGDNVTGGGIWEPDPSESAEVLVSQFAEWMSHQCRQHAVPRPSHDAMRGNQMVRRWAWFDGRVPDGNLIQSITAQQFASEMGSRISALQSDCERFGCFRTDRYTPGEYRVSHVVQPRAVRLVQVQRPQQIVIRQPVQRQAVRRIPSCPS